MSSLVWFVTRAVGIIFVSGAILFPIWLAVAWWSIKLRLNISADLEPDLLRFFVTIVAPYVLLLGAIFFSWRTLSEFDDRLNGSEVWRRG